MTKITTKRKKLGMTQAELARLAFPCFQAHISVVEKGRPIPEALAKRIAAALQTTVSQLFNRVQKPRPYLYAGKRVK